MNVVEKLKEYKKRVDPELKKYFEKKIEQAGELDPLAVEAVEIIADFTLSGGKRIRPVLLLLSSELFNNDVSIAIEGALAIETFHNFTLIHDDIMDNAPIRRGKDTVHVKWGVNNAILSGDVMMVEANRHLTRLDTSVLKEVLTCFNDTASGVCEGQQLDMEF